MRPTFKLATLALLSAFTLQPSALLGQRSLSPPPGAPAPTMKTFEQSEPRIPIGPDTTPGDFNTLYRITQPGSYYLTGNLQGVSNNLGITARQIADSRAHYNLQDGFINADIVTGSDAEFNQRHGFASCFLVQTCEAINNSSDGIPDAWELTHTNTLATFSASSDTDGDGVSDLAEYQADTHPLDSADAFRVISLAPDAASSTATLTWTSP